MKKTFFVLTMALVAGTAMAQNAPEIQGFEPSDWPAALLAILQGPQPSVPPPPPVAPPGTSVFRSGSYFGIGVAEIDAERAKAHKLSEERGVEVTRVERDSPAAKAGVQVGDVVLEFNGEKVRGTEQFVRLVRETPPNRPVTLLISRNGATQTVTATVASRRPRDRFPGPEFDRDMDQLRRDFEGFRFRMPDIPQPNMSWRSSILGVEAEAVSSQLAQFFGVKEGVLVRSVVSGSAAEKAGLKAGDVITRVDGEAVRTPGQISNRIRRLNTQTFPLTLVRNKQEMTITVTIEQERSRQFGERPPDARHHLRKSDFSLKLAGKFNVEELC